MNKIVIAIALFFCVIEPLEINAQDSTAIKKYYNEFGVSEIPDSLANGISKDSSVLKLNDAILIGLVNSPKLKSMKMEITAFQASALQAELYPNPVIGIDLENILGSGNYGGLGGSENTFYITQDFILGGRLSVGKDVELLKSDIAAWELEKERLSLITEIRKSFTLISSLEYQNKLNKQLLEVSLDFQKNLERRIEAGKVSPAEASRASLISTSLEIQIQNTEMKYLSEIQNLKALMGNSGVQFSSVELIYNLEYNIPDEVELQKSIFNSPDLAQFKTNLKKAETEINLQKSLAMPDLSLSLGYRRINETSDNVMVMGASIPINIFDNNRGNIQEAKIRADQTKYKYRGFRISYETKLSILLNNIKGLSIMIEKMNSESLPKARSVFEIINKGNLVGRFTVLDVLDSQRSLYELESQFVNAVAMYNRNVIELEALTLTKFNYNKKARIFENE